VANYEQWWRLFVEPAFGGKPISSIRTAQVSRWASELTAAGYSGSTVRNAHSTLRLVLEHAVHEERLTRNPAVGARLPSREVGDPRTALTGSQVTAIANAIVDATSRPQPQYRTLVLFLASTGLRIGEASALRVGDLNLGRRVNGRSSPTAHVRLTAVPVKGKLIEGTPKSGKVRTVALPPSLLDQLSALVSGRQPDDTVFTSPRGAQLRDDVFLRLHWRPTVAKLGLGSVTPHVLRHTFATEALSRGISLPVVANQLGHANPAITASVYAHLLEDDLDVVGQTMDKALSESHSEQRRNDGPDLQVV
jgi:integrase